MTQVVEANAAQPDLVDELDEPVGEAVRVQGGAVRAGEDEVVVVVGVAESLAVRVLAESMSEQHAYGVRIEVDQTVLATGGLGPAERKPAVISAAQAAGSGVLGGHRDDLLPNEQAVLAKLHVAPTEPQHLATASRWCG